jgi:hypothetical protein
LNGSAVKFCRRIVVTLTAFIYSVGTSPSADPYVRLTYPASWIKRYLLMGYQDIDLVLREC